MWHLQVNLLGVAEAYQADLSREEMQQNLQAFRNFTAATKTLAPGARVYLPWGLQALADATGYVPSIAQNVLLVVYGGNQLPSLLARLPDTLREPWPSPVTQAPRPQNTGGGDAHGRATRARRRAQTPREPAQRQDPVGNATARARRLEAAEPTADGQEGARPVAEGSGGRPTAETSAPSNNLPPDAEEAPELNPIHAEYPFPTQPAERAGRREANASNHRPSGTGSPPARA